MFVCFSLYLTHTESRNLEKKTNTQGGFDDLQSQFRQAPTLFNNRGRNRSSHTSATVETLGFPGGPAPQKAKGRSVSDEHYTNLLN